MLPRSLTADRWTRWHLVGAVLMALAGLAATWSAWANIHELAATDEENSHIFLVPLVAVWLIWVRRGRFRHCSPSGTMVGPLLVAFGWGISTYGFYNSVQSLWHGGAVVIVIGCILSVLGKNVLFRFFPAFLVLIFLVPVPGRIRLMIAQPLQVWTAQTAQVVLQYIGIETTLSGNVLSINGTDVTVAEACNGLRMVFALILVVFAFSFGMPLRNSVRFIILFLSPLAAIVCNVIRILPTVWIFGNMNQDFAVEFHDMAGWFMLPIAFLMLLGIIQILKWAMIPVTRYTLAAQT